MKQVNLILLIVVIAVLIGGGVYLYKDLDSRLVKEEQEKNAIYYVAPRWGGWGGRRGRRGDWDDHHHN